MLFAIVVYFATGSAQRTAQEEARQTRIMKRHAKLKLTKSQKSKANIVIEERVSKEKDKEGIMGENYRADTEWPDKRATIKIDYQYIKKVGNYDDMVTTITHELDHGFGLGHNKDKNSLMSAYDDSDHRQTLPAKDIKKARGIYLALEHYELKEKTTK